MKRQTPIRFVKGIVMAWCKTKEREHGLVVFRLKKPTKKDIILSFPRNCGCVQDLHNPE